MGNPGDPTTRKRLAALHSGDLETERQWVKGELEHLGRLALLDLAERRGETEEQALKRVIREAVRADCLRPEAPRTDRELPAEGEHGTEVARQRAEA